MIFLLVEFYLRITHKLRTPHTAEPVELMHHREKAFADFQTELPTKPGLIVIIQRFATHTVDVPGHIEEKLDTTMLASIPHEMKYHTLKEKIQ